MVATEVTLAPPSAAVAGALVELGEQAADLREPFGTLAEDLARAQGARFSARGEGTWPPPAAATIERKMAAYPGRPLLERSGRLRQEVTQARPSVGQLDLVLRVVSRVAGLHQRGTRRMPRRPLVSFTQGDRDRALDVVQQHLARVVADAAARIRSS